jgi:DNA-3-methyladenine glycosylase II
LKKAGENFKLNPHYQTIHDERRAGEAEVIAGETYLPRNSGVWIVSAKRQDSDLVESNLKSPGKKAKGRFRVISEKNRTLTLPRFHQALDFLKGRDPDLRRVLSRLGPPPMWKRAPGFPTLVQIILEQQVSLASARAAFHRLLQTVPVLTPEEFLKLDGPTLKQIGFSRQKARYSRHLAESINRGILNLERLKRMDDEQARAELIKIPGIGRWTADIYLLMALRRPNVWPAGDLALVSAVQQVKGLGKPPSLRDLEDLSRIWEPWKAVAARIFWHQYLNAPGKNKKA